MSAGVKLRCLTSANRYVVAGRTYEVAEILEFQGHAMVRKPNGKWPNPGEWCFALHPEEYFESPKTGIPALSCGYAMVDMEFYGVILPNSIFPTPAPGNSPTERTLEHERISAIIENAGVKSLWWLTYRNVITTRCFPDALESKFMLIGIDYRNLGRETSFRSASRAMTKVMRALRIPKRKLPAIDEQYVEFWHRSWREPGQLTW